MFDQPHLTPVQLHVLLALAPGASDEYAIMQEIVALSGGAMRAGPGTTYRALRALIDAGLVAEAGARPDPQVAGLSRVLYDLTAQGRAALAAEAERLERLARVARERVGKSN